ncbi:unnamed protein product [Cuscuta epithymum]|uniref:F-box domain-containing protein n=1 Tax=Cuscuta epithymum TaxID=186058 RepID=A0AAV0CLM6_9ASTE|nr:unnamed protein product [Cuscuta epithymum]
MISNPVFIVSVMNDQILAEILVRLPPKSVYRFRAVSKSWNQLISHPYFIEKYDRQQRRPDGVGLLSVFKDISCPCSFCQPKKRKKLLEYPSLELEVSRMFPGQLRFINSSNGLILCKGRRCNEKEYEYLVLNPVTKRLVSLPPPPLSWPSERSVGLMCEENKSQLSAKYIVVLTDYLYLNESGKATFPIVTYSSETRVWVAAKLRAIGTAAEKDFHSVFQHHPLVMNGVFHWYHYSRETGTLTLALYRPDGEAAVLDFRSYDGFGSHSTCSGALTRSPIENGDVLWFALVDVFGESMGVFMLPKGSQGWVSVYTITVESLRGDHTALLSSSRIFLNGLVPVNNKKTPVALIRMEKKGRVFLCDVDTKAVQSLPYHGRPVITKWDEVICGPDFIAHYPYLPPSSLSTFAL